MAVRLLSRVAWINTCSLTRTLGVVSVNAVRRDCLATVAKSSEWDVIEPISDITIKEVCVGVLDDNLVLVDVREPHEVEETGRIGHSLNIPLSQLVEVLSLSNEEFEKRYNHPRPDEDQDNLVLYCKSGVRALKGCELLAEEGFTKVRRYPGSMTEWQTTLLGLRYLSKFSPAGGTS